MVLLLLLWCSKDTHELQSSFKKTFITIYLLPNIPQNISKYNFCVQIRKKWSNIIHAPSGVCLHLFPERLRCDEEITVLIIVKSCCFSYPFCCSYFLFLSPLRFDFLFLLLLSLLLFFLLLLSIASVIPFTFLTISLKNPLKDFFYSLLCFFSLLILLFLWPLITFLFSSYFIFLNVTLAVANSFLTFI